MSAARRAVVVLGTDTGGLRRGLRKAERNFKKFGRRAVRGLKGAFSTITTVGGAAGAFGLASASRDIGEFEEKLTRLQIQSRDGIDADKMRSQIDNLSDSTSVARGEILESARAYVSMSGDAEGAARMLDLFAKSQKASGAAAEDVARMASGLKQTMGVDTKDMERAFSIILSGGKSGAIEMREMAAIVGGIAPQFRRFGEDGVSGLARLNAAIQTIAPEFNGQASEAATGMKSFMGSIEKNAPRIKKMLKFDVFKKDGTLKNTRELAILFGKADKKGKNLFKALGPKLAVTTARALAENIEKWDGITESQRGANDVAEDYMAMMNSKSGRLQKAFNDMKQTVAKLFTPERIEKFVLLVDQLSELLTFAVKHARGLAVAFAAIKLAPLISGVTMFTAQMGGAVANVAGLSAGLAGAIGKMSTLGGLAAKAGLVGAAGVGGFALGTALDRKFGLSDKLAGVDTSVHVAKGDLVGEKLELARSARQQGDINAALHYEKMADAIAKGVAKGNARSPAGKGNASTEALR